MVNMCLFPVIDHTFHTMKHFHNIHIFTNTFKQSRAFVFVQLQPCNQPALSAMSFIGDLFSAGPAVYNVSAGGARGGTSTYGGTYPAISHRAGMNTAAHNRHTTRSTKRPTRSTKRPTTSTKPPTRSLKGGSKPPTKKGEPGSRAQRENQSPV